MTTQRTLALGLGLLAFCTVPVHAQEPTSRLELTLSTGPDTDPEPRPHQSLPSRGTITRTESLRKPPQPAPNTVMARVGSVIAGRAEIRLDRTSRSRLLSVVSRGTNLAVLNEAGAFYGVLMVNNTLGWIPKSAVQLIDYQAPVALAPQSPAAPSRSGFDTSSFDIRTQTLLREAFSYLGVPYVWAGNTRSGIDCSGFLKSVFGSLGIALPRHSGDQANVGMPVSWNELRAGDRLYFAMKGGRTVNHCGIYLGNGYFIHASSNHGHVDVDPLTKANYSRALVCARRS